MVISGLGIVSGFGAGIEPLWSALMEGRSCLKPITAFDPSAFPSRLGGPLDPSITARDYVPKHYRKATKVMARDSELAVIAAQLAVQDADILTRANIPEGTDATPTIPSRRTGCQIGAGLIAAETDELALAMATARDPHGTFDLKRWGTISPPGDGANADGSGGGGGGGGMNNLTPLWMLKYLPNMLACHVTIVHGCEGPSNTHTCSEASSLLCLGESLRVIQRGDADLCFSGGAEAPLNLMRFMRMELSGRLAPTGNQTDASTIVRPFDPVGTGTLIADGGGILLLEAEESVKARGGKVYARVAGFGAGHSPALWAARKHGQSLLWIDSASDEGLVYAIQAALADARLTPGDIDLVVPLAAGIPAVDCRELGALRAVFGSKFGSLAYLPLTPFVGCSLAGHGTIQAACAALATSRQLPSITRRLDRSAPIEPLPLSGASRTTLVTCSSLAGHSAALVLQAP